MKHTCPRCDQKPTTSIRVPKLCTEHQAIVVLRRVVSRALPLHPTDVAKVEMFDCFVFWLLDEMPDEVLRGVAEGGALDLEGVAQDILDMREDAEPA